MVTIWRTRGVGRRSASRDRNLGPSSPEEPSPTTRLCRVAAGRCAVAASSFSPTAYFPRGWTRSGGRSVATVLTWLRPRHKSGEFSLRGWWRLNPHWSVQWCVLVTHSVLKIICLPIHLWFLATILVVVITRCPTVGWLVNHDFERMWNEASVAEF